MQFSDIRVDILKKENQKLKSENENLKYELELTRRKYDSIAFKAKLYDEKYEEFNDTVEDLKRAKELYSTQMGQIKEMRASLIEAVDVIKGSEQA